MDVSVLGCGRWGSFLAWYSNRTGHRTVLYGREGSERMEQLAAMRSNGVIRLEESVGLTTSLKEAVGAEVIIISVGAQSFAGLCGELAELLVKKKYIILCMKGIEAESGRRLSEIAGEALDGTNRILVWLGPGHVQEFCAGVPNCMVMDSLDEAAKEKMVDEFSSDLIRFYYGRDLIGNEVGAAAKNVIGIAAGMLDGLRLSSLKGALMSRGTREIARLIKAMGGSELSAYGLCHLGDYEATVFSKYSHNRRFGEALIKGESYDELAEGAYTVRAMMKLGEKYGVSLPICRAVYEVLYKEADAAKTLDGLFSRSLKNEF